jgi:hypothetical protein
MGHSIAHTIVTGLILPRDRWDNVVEGIIKVSLRDAKHRRRARYDDNADILLEDCQTSLSQKSCAVRTTITLGTRTMGELLEVDVWTKIDRDRQGLQN